MQYKSYIAAAIALMAVASSQAQESTNSGVSRRNPGPRNRTEQQAAPGVTDRMLSSYTDPNSSLSEGDMQWMRVIYRSIDLNEAENAPLYFPEDVVDGQENLFRIIMRLLADNQIPAYEYLDGREVFTDQYRVKVKDILDRFYIVYNDAKGSTEKNPKYVIDEADIPTTEVLSYYAVERWEFDNRNNRMRQRIDAICPVLHRSGDFGGEPLKYPMFWVKYSDLRPYLTQQLIFVSDENNLPTCSYDDYFNLAMYKGEIYKTRNLRNKSMMQLYPDPEERKLAQDSIQASLDKFEDKLWVPNREEIIAAREAREAAELAAKEAADSLDVIAPTDDGKAKRRTARTPRNSTKVKKESKPKVKQPKASKPKSSSTNAARSVRRSRK